MNNTPSTNVKQIMITPNMSKSKIDYATGFLLDVDKTCTNCGKINLMDRSDKCQACIVKKSKCKTCDNKCHSDDGGVYANCINCISKNLNCCIYYNVLT